MECPECRRYQLGCENSLIDMTASKLYGQDIVAVLWSYKVANITISDWQFRIELYDPSGVLRKQVTASSDMREYDVDTTGYAITGQWQFKIWDVEEIFFIWHDCGSLTRNVTMLQQGQNPKQPQQSAPPWYANPILYYVILGTVAVVGVGYAIGKIRGK